MASSNLMYAIGTGAAIVAIGGAVISSRNAEQDVRQAHLALLPSGEQPLAMLDGRDPTSSGRLSDARATNRYPSTLDLAGWSPTGWMGDGKGGSRYLQFDASHTASAHSPPACIRIQYDPGPTGWAGQYWLNSEDNWGSQPGADLSRYSRIVFWARGERGGERVEFKAGSIDTTRITGARHKDSFAASLGRLDLASDWRRYEIDLVDMDLSSVIGAFAWVATVEDNPDGLVFYLDGLRYE